MPQQNRQLAAIMFTDIVGYTSLMGTDEQEAMQLLRKNREIHKSTIKKHQGKWLKEMGDGTLASFKTVSDAVYCAGELIKGCKEENIQLRIGIHEGEVVVEDGDIFGDGVNIASRLEPLAEPGQILVSGPVHRNIKNKSGISSTFFKETKLKNVDEPVKVYSIVVNDQLFDNGRNNINLPSNGIKYSRRNKILFSLGFILVMALIISYFFNPLGDIVTSKTESANVISGEKSLAVLPFKNLGSNEEHQYYIDGIVEDILTKLSRIKELRIISNTTSGQYKNTDKSIPKIGEELNVKYIVEGSGRIIGDQFKVTVQLIDAEEDQHIWAMDTIVVLQDILSIQNNIAAKITSNLKINLSLQDEQLINSDLTQNPLAYGYYLKAQSVDETLDPSNYLSKIIQLLKKAIELDENFDQAWAELSEAYIERINYSDEPTSNIDSAKFACEKALEINPLNSFAYYAKANIYQRTGNQEMVFENTKKAYELGSTHMMVFYWLSQYYRNSKKYEDASMVLLDGLSRSLIYDVESLDFYNQAAWSFLNGSDFEIAEKIFTKGLRLFQKELVFINGLRIVSKIKEDFESEKNYSKVLYDSQLEYSIYIVLYAQSLLKDKQYLEAEKLYEKYIKDKNKNLNATQDYDEASCLYELGFIKIKLGKENEGNELIKDYINLRSENKNYINYDLARCYVLLGNMDESLNYLKKAHSFKIWFNYKDPIFEELNLPAEITEYIDTKVKEHEIEMENARIIFRDLYEKLIAAGKLKRIEDYL